MLLSDNHRFAEAVDVLRQCLPYIDAPLDYDEQRHRDKLLDCCRDLIVARNLRRERRYREHKRTCRDHVAERRPYETPL